MQKRIASVLGASLIPSDTACSGGTPANDVLPTLAHLPTALPTATIIPATATMAITATVFTDVPTKRPVWIVLATGTSADVTFAPDEPTATLLPVPDSSQPSILPTLVIREDTTLQGQMTIIDDNHALLTDSEGNTALVLIDPFAAQIGANELVQIRGTIKTEADKLVLRMTEIKILTGATAEPSSTDEVPPPTGAIPSPTAT